MFDTAEPGIRNAGRHWCHMASLPFYLLLLAAPALMGVVRVLMAVLVLGCVGLLATWYYQRRGAGGGSAPAREAIQAAAPRYVYSVEKVLGANGTKYGQHLLSRLEQLEASLTPPPPLPGGTTPPELPGTAAATANQNADPEEVAAAPASTAQPPEPPATAALKAGGGDQEIEEFSRQVSCPPELRPAPTPSKRFSARKSVVNPDAMAQLQRTRATTFLPTDTGQHIPMLAEKD